MLDCVLSVLDPLTSTRTENLLLMKSSAHFLDRMAASLQSPQLLANKAQAQVLGCVCVTGPCVCHWAVCVTGPCVCLWAVCVTGLCVCHCAMRDADWQAELAASRREEAVAMALNLQPQLEALVSDTRTLQKQVPAHSLTGH